MPAVLKHRPAEHGGAPGVAGPAELTRGRYTLGITLGMIPRFVPPLLQAPASPRDEGDKTRVSSEKITQHCFPELGG